MTNLEKLRAAIIEAVPEIVERVDKEVLGYAYWFRLHKSWSDEEILECVTGVQPKITLADVLRAIPGGELTLVIDDMGEFGWRTTGKRDVYWLGVYWNLAKDNLDDQSPETIDFLTSVLCNG